MSDGDCTKKQVCGRCKEYSARSKVEHNWTEWSPDYVNLRRFRTCLRCSEEEHEQLETVEAASTGLSGSLDGIWLAGDGLPVQFSQTDNRLAFQGTNQFGSVVVNGAGTVSGNQAQLFFRYFDGMVYEEATATMQISSDWRTMEGLVYYRKSGVSRMMGLVRQY